MKGVRKLLVAAFAVYAAAMPAISAEGGGRGALYKPKAGWVRTASVHDPSIFKDRDGKYYIVGTHLASAESANLISWKQTSTLRNAIDGATAEKLRAYNADESVRNWFDYLWAPDIIYNKKMRSYNNN